MPHLSFKKDKGAKPVAIIKDGKLDGKVLYLNDEDLDKNEEIDIKSSGGKFQLLPTPDRGKEKREVWYICGKSGSGKSFMARQLAYYYKELHPSRPIYLISKLSKDSTLDPLKPIRLKISTFVEDYPEKPEEDFANSMLIMDDVDTFTGEEEKAVAKLTKDLACLGRHGSTSVLYLTHKLTDGHKTKIILNESSHFVLFPNGVSPRGASYLLKNHIGVNREMEEFRKGTRWVMFHNNFPPYYITEFKAGLLYV